MVVTEQATLVRKYERNFLSLLPPLHISGDSFCYSFLPSYVSWHSTLLRNQNFPTHHLKADIDLFLLNLKPLHTVFGSNYDFCKNIQLMNKTWEKQLQKGKSKQARVLLQTNFIHGSFEPITAQYISKTRKERHFWLSGRVRKASTQRNKNYLMSKPL